ncbi:hypothetical protein F4803DRAFT_205353 [Xylaria telfairii]|nr:hypothetical protein F4803DRAFT_205353 [Xylaria telfairii]
MRSRVTQIPGVEWLQPRGLTIPSACYSICNNCFLEAQVVGKVPELCDPDSAFMMYYNACTDCVDSIGEHKSIDDVDPAFYQFIDYCAAETEGTTATRSTTVAESAPSTPLAAVTVLVPVPYTATINGVTTIWSFTKALTSYAPLPNTTVLSVTTSQDGHLTVWTFVKTLTPLAKDTLVDMSPSPSTTPQQTPQVSDSTSTNPAGTTMSDNSHRSRAWLAGPVIGATSYTGRLL